MVPWRLPALSTAVPAKGQNYAAGEPSLTRLGRAPGFGERRFAEIADVRAVSGQPGEIANQQDGNTSECGRLHPVQHVNEEARSLNRVKNYMKESP